MVLRETRPHLKALQPLAKELNELSDNFTAELRVIEDELNKLNLGVEAEGPYIFEEGQWESVLDEQCDREIATRRQVHFLAYTRNSAPTPTWKIVVRRYWQYHEPHEPDFVLIDERFLISASRALRLAAAAHVDGLLTAITEEAKKKVDALKKATDK